MLGISCFRVDFSLFAQEEGFHFVLKRVSRFQISYVAWDIIPDFCTVVRKTLFESFSISSLVTRFCYKNIIILPEPQFLNFS